jgi:drug/metabolite transporter (DMT)-like permease
MVVPVLLAIFMTFITASSNILLKKGFSKINPLISSYFSIFISVVFLWIATWLFVPRGYFHNFKGILVFIVVGSFAPTIVRTLTYYGIDRIGAGRAAPLRAMTPFFAVIMAVMFLKESPKPIIFIAISLIILGVFLITKKNEKDVHLKLKPRHFLYPLGAAFLAGLAANMRKYGLNIMAQPIFASAIAATSSLFMLSFYIFLKRRKEIASALSQRRELRLVIIAALLTSCGEVVDLSALLYGSVSLVVPIFATTPLIIVFLSWIFLKNHEVVTKRIVLAAIIIVLGLCLTVVSK